MTWPGVTEAARQLAPPAPDDEPDDIASRSPWGRLVARFRKNRTGMAALTFLILLVGVALAAPILTPYDPAHQALTHINEGPSGAHWLGTDYVGRDILSRLIYGARVSLLVATIVVSLAAAAAVPIGLAAGYFGGLVDSILMRFMDALFTFPPLALALAIAVLLGPSITNAAIAIAIPFVPGYARLVRAEVLAVREEVYIEASRSIGVGSGRMLRRHVLPNVASPLVVQVAISFGYALLAEAGLSFLGFGVQPPHSSWGTMLQAAYSFINNKPWPLVPPGVAIMLTVLAFNLVGDGLRDSLGREVFKIKGSLTGSPTGSLAGSLPAKQAAEPTP